MYSQEIIKEITDDIIKSYNINYTALLKEFIEKFLMLEESKVKKLTNIENELHRIGTIVGKR